ncbi:hypothetical protein Gogos_009660, partial [Gossypium gossypioides]|nr:hypothetical protein [Gossypium gossypioides]
YWATHYISTRKGGSSIRHISREETTKIVRWIQLSSNGTVKINTSCVVVGVLKDQNGEWIFGFNRRLRKCFVFEAELCGIIDGVTLVQGRQHDRVFVLTNNLEVIRVIKEALSK